MAELTEAAEAVEEVVEEATKNLPDGFYIRGWVGTVLTVAGSGLGTFVGYRLADRKLRKEYERIAEDEIDQMRTHFRQQMVAREEKPDLSDLAKRTAELGYSENSDTPAPPGEVNTPVVPEDVRNVFEDTAKDAAEGWDYEVELASRMEDKPYVIHYDEREEKEYEEITLTYYAGDDVLCDENDKVVDSPDFLVGAANLDKFGHGSNDKNVVYVRNESLTIDIEVVRSDKTYAEEVHGFKHEDPPRRRRLYRED